MTPQEARKEAMARGFTHVKTYGGLVPITDWKPYGGNDKVILTWDVNVHNIMYDVANGQIDGIWRFTKEKED